MSEFTFVQWGESVPMDYQRFAAMMNNEQYLKDKIDAAPRGVLLWKQTTNTQVYNPSGGTQTFGDFSNLQFSVEANRLLKVTFNLGQTTSSGGWEFWYLANIDGTTTSHLKGQLWQGTGSHQTTSTLVWIVPTALSQGTHSISIQYTGNSGSNVTIDARSLVVEDIGSFIAQSP